MPTKGQILISLISIGRMESPLSNLWVASCSFTTFMENIGTDILTELGAIINCPDQSIKIHLLWTSENIPLIYYGNQIYGLC